jgi:hypothetical protein
MKTLALLLLSLPLAAQFPPCWDCTLSWQGCDSCHVLGNTCGSPQGQYCIDCNILCPTLSALQEKAAARKQSLDRALNPAHLSDAGAIWKLLSDHLASFRPVERSAQVPKLPVGHPPIKLTGLSCKSKVR